MTTSEKALLLHEEWKGKLETVSKVKVVSREDPALAYTPGVAEPRKTVARDPEATYLYTIESNTIAVVSDGSAVLGLGNIGPLVAMPVIEEKSVLFKELDGANAFPICLDAQDMGEIIETVIRIAPTFGDINLGDIAAPHCFEIEEALKERLDIPVFHDDQHGIATVALTDVINALKVTGRRKEECHAVVNGAGSAGMTITKLFLAYGFPNTTICDRSGVPRKGAEGPSRIQEKMMDATNLEHRTGSLTGAMKGAGILIGISAPDTVTSDMAASMSKGAIIFAMANPAPEIMSDLAKAVGTRVVGTGRSDFPNQANNTVVFPGIFKGALEGRATAIMEEMKLAITNVIAGLVDEKDLDEDNTLLEALDPRVTRMVSQAVKDHI